MSKFRENVLISKTGLSQPDTLSLKSEILLKIIQPPKGLFFRLSDLANFMDLMMESDRGELQEVMDSLISKGFISGAFQIDGEGKRRDSVYEIRRLKPNENDLLSLQERAILQILVMSTEKRGNPVISYGFTLSDALASLSVKFGISTDEVNNRIQELIDCGDVEKYQLVKELGGSPFTLCFARFCSTYGALELFSELPNE